MEVKTPSQKTLIGKLSGGNQQKVIIKCENQNHISIIQSNPLSQPKFLQPKQKPKYQQTKLNQY